MKRKLFSFLSCVIAASLLMTPAAYAHNKDVFPISYTSNNQKNLTFRISGSAQTSLLNKEVYESALKWNNISSNVHVTIIMETPGMPTIANTMGVYDGRGGSYNGVNYFVGSEACGLTQLFDSNGNKISNPYDSSFKGKVAYVKILMDVDETYGTLSKPAEGAAMTFTHEVGHTLMLAHPESNYLLDDHTMSGGKPYAVMNQGVPSTYPYVSLTPTSHDKSCLIYKWGK